MAKVASIVLLTVYGVVIAGSVVLTVQGFWIAAAGVIGGILVASEEAGILLADARNTVARGFEVKMRETPTRLPEQADRT